ncbi:carbamoyltransferase HypF [Flavilitoribacter nigricans]|uniref:carbamoyltransferase HypF n=1 Tax=Flavilitoribacter nigricans TaxID=70997 RepID=UPI001473B67E|nr:carbamoyltransferase HypF [Flavilitoribacter nigricans]
MKSWHLHIKGQVQGVGFRPFVYQLALQQQLHGWVNNTVDGVHVVFHADAETAHTFTGAILDRAPRLARITSHRLRPTEDQTFTDFQIIHSHTEGEVQLMLTPDFALCDTCRTELHETGNRRKDYPFITCTHCGPRFSISRQLPYDRETTTMAAFTMCPECQEEYHDPTDRRYYSQTNSCPACAVTLYLSDHQLKTVSEDVSVIIERVCQYWHAGKIVAIKGIGGYLLTCDARNRESIAVLRARKHRPDKPFALMYPSEHAVLEDLDAREEELTELSGSCAPIVLLPLKEQHTLENSRAEIAPGLSRIGVMLPYTPIFELLLQAFGGPIVATSGNISNAPIVFEDKKAQTDLTAIADYLLTNNREIVFPQDDSVVQFSPFGQQRIILRRSRGMAPSFFDAPAIHADGSLLAMGAMLKHTFSLYHRGNTFVSQYLGDLQHFATEESCRHTLEHFFRLFDTQPEMILVDQHPDYPSTLLGNTLAEKFEVPVSRIQHHIAHFGAVLGENDLIDCDHPVLGVIWDGTGLGDDGQIWGGEFFLYQHYDFTRWGQLDYFPLLLNDKMAKEPRLAALSLAKDRDAALPLLRDKFTDTEWKIYQKILTEEEQIQTSSIGRLFDGIASLLGLSDRQTYEGEAAIKLEELATGYFRRNGLSFADSYGQDAPVNHNLPTRSLVAGVVHDLQAGKATDYIAAKFHYSLIDRIRRIADAYYFRHIACSGGVFQNGLLVDLLRHHLPANYQLYLHRDLSPNDENISFGQLMCHQIEILKKSNVNLDHKYQNVCV